jgi:hypothetical protein
MPEARCGFESRLAHGARSARAFCTQCPFVQSAGRWTLNPVIVVRIHGGQLRRRARLRPRPRKAGDPGRHRVAAPCACSPTGRGARSRAWRLRVRIPPSTPRPWVQRPGGPCRSGSRGWHSAGAPLPGCSVGRGTRGRDDAGSISARPARALRIGVHASLVWTRCPVRHRGRAPRDRSVSG